MVIAWIWLCFFSLENETSNLSSWWTPPPHIHLLTLPEVATWGRLDELQQLGIRCSSAAATMFLLLSAGTAQEGTRVKCSYQSWDEKNRWILGNQVSQLLLHLLWTSVYMALKHSFNILLQQKIVLNMDSWMLLAELLCYQASAVKRVYPGSQAGLIS